MSNTVVEKLFRPPHEETRAGGTEPLTVLFSLLSRADNTPLQERRLGEGHTLDDEGKPILDPANNPAPNGFESNPNLHFEHWGEYWRKVHGVRFTHVEEPDDKSLERLLRYDQLHRFAPGPTSSDAPPYYAPADGNGKLWPTVIGHIEAYRRPRWDGVAYLNFATPDDIGVVFANERVRTKILPEDKAMFRDIAPILARQHIIIPSATGNEAVTFVKLHVRRHEVNREAFQRWWLNEHAPVVGRLAQRGNYVKRYVQLHNIGPEQAGEPLFHPEASALDGVSLLGFANVADLEDFLTSPASADINEHESQNVDQSSSEFWTTIDLVVVNRIHREVRSQ